MAKPRYSRDQIRAVLDEVDTGLTLKDVSQKYGISVSTLYRWRSKLAEKKEPARDSLRLLQIENRRLKSKFAELVLDYTSLRAALIQEGTNEC
ncbi:MAG: transposase [Nitrospira sp.]|nr:transposase [Nitrospira sp.]MBX3338061.1 transposase [Nitrospira sp.]MCW5780415.1 transposase [Nitrospira sp.]